MGPGLYRTWGGRGGAVHVCQFLNTQCSLEGPQAQGTGHGTVAVAAGMGSCGE